MDGQKILVVEDTERIARLLQINLRMEGFKVSTEGNGRRAYERIMQEDYDLVLLDIMLPEMDGFEICKKVREVSEMPPIIMLTAKDDLQDKIAGLKLGAIDYMTKPFSTDELLIRIRNTLKIYAQRKDPNQRITRYVVKSLILCPETREVTVKNEKIELSQKEFDLLKYLIENKKIVLSRDTILEKVWGYDYYGDTNVVDVYIHSLRDKIDKRFNEKYIHTERGIGYVIRD